jgi:hypothetical protein
MVAAFSSPLTSLCAAAQRSGEPEFHGVDFHVHLDNSTLDKVLDMTSACLLESLVFTRQ